MTTMPWWLRPEISHNTSHLVTFLAKCSATEAGDQWRKWQAVCFVEADQ
jgi:hypothetical protein